MVRSAEGKDQMDGDSRRRLLGWAWLTLGGIAIGEFVWIVVSFLKPRRPRWARSGDSTRVWTAGPVEGFAPATVTAFPRGRFYLVRLDDGGFLALSRECTHLGCTVAWIGKEKRFVCPCHASGFDITGDVLHAPAPRALDVYPVRIENDLVKVDTGKRTRRTGFRDSQVTHPGKT